jgi:hypothetical protein
MISWIQHHLIRHGRWIFLTLLALIIVAFVFTRNFFFEFLVSV